MNRRRIRKWALWLLPILALRALVPVGFMLTAGPAGLELVFCSAQALGAAAPADVSLHQVHGEEHQAHGAAERLNTPCPFALVTAALPVCEPMLQGVALVTNDEPVPRVASHAICAGPERIDSIRGPPALS